MSKIDLHAVVKKLAGNITPVGETNEDKRRLENLKNTIELVDYLIGDLDRVMVYKDRTEHSMKIAGVHASTYLSELADNLQCDVGR